jgi:ABC-type sugar transport system ATPase subunit
MTAELPPTSTQDVPAGTPPAPGDPAVAASPGAPAGPGASEPGAPEPGAPEPGAPEPLLSLHGVTKTFGPVTALDDVSLDVYPGEILALIGENGAGKSTLLRVLSGDHHPDRGQLLQGDREVSLASPRAAHQLGIRVIYQEPEIAATVSVAENLFMGELPTRLGPFVDRRRLMRDVEEVLARSGFGDEIDPRMQADRLSPAQRQLVEILKAMKGDVRVLALDEPTSSLTEEEVKRLVAIVEGLRDEGVGIIYVSHRIREIMRLADRVAVLRDGKLVAVRKAGEATEDELVQLMVGRPVQSFFGRRSHARQEVALRVEGLTTDWLRDVSFDVRHGEVVGLAGLIGAGRTELARTLFGLSPITSGSISIDGRALRLRSPKDAIGAGIGFAPEDRKREGLFLPRSVGENISISILERLRRFRFMRFGRERRLVDELIERLSVRTPSASQEISKLSGGNQQKAVLARWLARRPRLLILDEPTRGVDVGAKAEIYRLIHDLAGEGMAILFISSELPEVLGVSDRILVMQNGRLTGELDASEATEQAVLALAMADHLTGPAAAGDPGDPTEERR